MRVCLERGDYYCVNIKTRYQFFNLFRKYHRGRIVGRRQMWVFGGICRENKQCFLLECPKNKRDKATLGKSVI